MKTVFKLAIITLMITSYSFAASKDDMTCISYTDSLKTQEKRTIDSISSMSNLAQTEVYGNLYLTTAKSLLKSHCAEVLARERSLSVQNVTDEYLRHLKIAEYIEHDIALWKKPCLSTVITIYDNLLAIAAKIPDHNILNAEEIKELKDALNIERGMISRLDTNECKRDGSKLITWRIENGQYQEVLNDMGDKLLKLIDQSKIITKTIKVTY